MTVERLPLRLGRGTILDLETTDLGAGSGIVCLGSVHDNVLRILARGRHSSADEFHQYLTPLLQCLPQPFYAYNAKFDAGFLRRQLGYRGPRLIDLFEPWRSRAESRNKKWPSLDELIRGPWDELPPYRLPVRDPEPIDMGLLREDEAAWLKRGHGSWRRESFENRGAISGRDVPRLWRKYVGGDSEALRLIAEHNRQDILKTLCLIAFLGRPLTE